MTKKNILIIIASFIFITLIGSYLYTEFKTNRKLDISKKLFEKTIDSLFGFQEKITIGYFNYDKTDLYADSNSANNIIIRLYGNTSKGLLNFTDKRLYQKKDGEFIKKVSVKSATNNFFRIKQIWKINEDTRTFTLTYLKDFEYFSDPVYLKSNLIEHKIFEDFVGQLYNRHLLDFGFKDAITDNETVIAYVNNLASLRLSNDHQYIISSKDNFYRLQLNKDKLVNANDTEGGKLILRGGMSLKSYPTRRLDANLYQEKYELNIIVDSEVIHHFWVDNFLNASKYLAVIILSIMGLIILTKALMKIKL